MKELQLINQNLWEKMKPIKVRLRALTCIWSKERPCLFCFFRSATGFLCVIFGDRACIYKRNYLSRNFCYVSVCSIWHVIISTQKYILTRVSTHDKRVWWPYMVSIITEYDQVRNQKLREKLKHQDFSSIFQNAYPVITWNTTAPGEFPPWNQYIANCDFRPLAEQLS